MDWEKIREQIEFEVNVEGLEDTIQRFSKFIRKDDNEMTLDRYILQAYQMLAKMEEDQPEEETSSKTEYSDVFVPKNRGRKNRNRKKELAKKHMKSITWTGATTETFNKKGVKRCGKNHQSFDWKKYDNSINRLGWKSEILRFSEVPVVSDPECEISNVFKDTGLGLCGEYFSDEIISNAIEKYNNPWWEKYELDDEDYDFGFDPYQSALDDREEAWNEISKLNNEIETYKAFIAEYNLGKLYTQWKESR